MLWPVISSSVSPRQLPIPHLVLLLRCVARPLTLPHLGGSSRFVASRCLPVTTSLGHSPLSRSPYVTGCATVSSPVAPELARGDTPDIGPVPPIYVMVSLASQASRSLSDDSTPRSLSPASRSPTSVGPTFSFLSITLQYSIISLPRSPLSCRHHLVHLRASTSPPQFAAKFFFEVWDSRGSRGYQPGTNGDPSHFLFWLRIHQCVYTVDFRASRTATKLFSPPTLPILDFVFSFSLQ